MVTCQSVIVLYTYETELYTYTNHSSCVNCHNMRNLYHIRVIDLRIQSNVCTDVEIQCSLENDLASFFSFVSS